MVRDVYAGLIAEALTAAHFGQNWGFTSMAPVVGGNIFLTLFGGRLLRRVPR